MDKNLENGLKAEEATINVEEISKENCFLASLNELDNSAYDLGFESDTTILKALIKQYGDVVMRSLVTSFGLDILIQDQYGGDVDTVHNVRQIGKDPKMNYKNSANEEAYNNRGDYNSYDYHGGNKTYRDTINENRNKPIEDGYVKDKTIVYNKNAPDGVKAQQDHVVSAKSIHDDRGAVLSGLNTSDLANDPMNLVFTNAALNNNMKDKSIPEFIEWCEKNPDKVNWNGVKGQPLPEDVKQELLKKYEMAKKQIDRRINKAYYTSPKFWKDTLSAASKRGFQMGLRQALGFVFMEIWSSALSELEKVQGNKDISVKFRAVGSGIKKGFENAKNNYKEIFKQFAQGGISGFLTSLVTTLVNTFTTLDENQVRMLRQIGPTVIEASKILFINPDNLLLGQRLKEVSKVIAVGASVLLGTSTDSAVNTALLDVPFFTIHKTLRRIISSFCGAMVSGLLSTTLLFILDHGKLINGLFEFLDSVELIENEINYYKEQAELFEKYAAKLMEIDYEELRKQTVFYQDLAARLSETTDEFSFNAILMEAIKRLDIALPWGDNRSFDDYMLDENAVLIIK